MENETSGVLNKQSTDVKCFISKFSYEFESALHYYGYSRYLIYAYYIKLLPYTIAITARMTNNFVIVIRHFYFYIQPFIITIVLLRHCL